MDPFTLAMLGSAGGGLLSGLGSFFGNKGIGAANNMAGQYSALAQMQALQQAGQNFENASRYLQPYMTGGSQSLNMLLKYLQGGANGIGGGGDSLISTFAPTIEQLEKTPGYQFIKDQGLKSVQNSAAAKGLGSSGNALQGGVNFAEGLASTTFQQQLQNYLAQNKQAFDMLYQPAGLGMNAAAANMQGTSNFNNVLMQGAGGIGNAMAGGMTSSAAANAAGLQGLFGGIGGGISSLANIPYGNKMFDAMYPKYASQHGPASLWNWSGDNPLKIVGGLGNQPVSTY